MASLAADVPQQDGKLGSTALRSEAGKYQQQPVMDKDVKTAGNTGR
jgi:hypothetical protein